MRLTSNSRFVRLVSILPAVLLLPLQSLALGIEERVAGMTALERVRHTHRIGETRTFEQAASPEAIRSRVLDDLSRAVALTRRFDRAMTAEDLEIEWGRMLRSSRMPSRLRELVFALGSDPVLVQELIVRPVLVRSWLEEAAAWDPALQREALEGARRIRRAIVEGRIDPARSHPRRIRLGDGQSTRAREAGYPGSVVETKAAFQFDVLAEGQGMVRYSVPKTTFESWWARNRSAFDPAGARTIADASLVGLEATVSATAAFCSADDTWDGGLTDESPESRESAVAVWTGNLVLVVGGRRRLDGFGTFYAGRDARYDPATDTWTRISETGAPGERSGHTGVWTGAELIVWGGETGDHPFQIDLQDGARYDPVLDQWFPTNLTGAPEGRANHLATWTGEEMIVWGGERTRFQAPAASDAAYDPLTDTWRPISDPPFGRGNTESTRGVWTGDELIVWGDPASSPGYRYAPSTDTWSPMSTVGEPSQSASLNAIWTGDEVLYWDGPASVHARYMPATDTWSDITVAGAPAFAGRAVWTGSKMIVWGDTSSVEGGIYDPAADAWTPMTTAGAPPPRMPATIVWTDKELFVWGGGLEGDPLGTRYDPVRDVWLGMSESGAPERRNGHTSIWTPAQMIVWGGRSYGDNSILADGGRYDPVTDSWQSVTMQGGPAARTGHTAVWDGTEMIVWGGSEAAGPLATGGKYDPAQDSWSPISAAGSPVARYDHTASMAGSEMIVWGGRDASSEFQTGGRYDPVADAWTPTTTTGAPVPRRDHTAVWTGGELVVWGGRDASSEFQTGGRYDPVADSWTPTTTTGAPAPRWRHTAVWTGDEMIVWGGIAAGTVDTGGRYDPAADDWEPTSVVGGPSARNGHVAVWTGSFMLIWGGTDPDGGRYAIGHAVDDDLDGQSECDGDCLDGDPSIWSEPGETTGLAFGPDKATLVWSPPAVSGTSGAPLTYDLLRSTEAIGFPEAECLDLADPETPSAADAQAPGAGEYFFYLSRAVNRCSTGGNVGAGLNATPRVATYCESSP